MAELRDAARQALEAWEYINKYGFVLADYEGPMEQAITALKAALEQPEQDTDCHARGICQRSGYGIGQPEQVVPYAVWRQGFDAVRKYKEQPEQEPVANNPDPYHLSRILHELAGSASMCWAHVDRAGVFQSTQAADVVAAALAEIRQRMKDAPPRREWRGLTEEEFGYIYVRSATHEEFARAIEAALKGRNA
jgi:hypothetical protein